MDLTKQDEILGVEERGHCLFSFPLMLRSSLAKFYSNYECQGSETWYTFARWGQGSNQQFCTATFSVLQKISDFASSIF